MMRLTNLAAVAMCFAAFCSSASATLINVDFNGNSSEGDSSNNGTFAGTGILGGGTWNGVSAPRVGTSPTSIGPVALVDSAGGSTGVTVSVGDYNNTWNAGNSSFIDATWQPLMSDHAYLYGSQTTATITLSGLGASTAWNVVLYGARGEGQGSDFVLGATTKTTSDTSTIGAALIENDEYVRFDNVLSDGLGNLAITWNLPSGNTFAALNGLQLHAVPEPSSLALLLMGTAALGVFRRKRSK